MDREGSGKRSLPDRGPHLSIQGALSSWLGRPRERPTLREGSGEVRPPRESTQPEDTREVVPRASPRHARRPRARLVRGTASRSSLPPHEHLHAFVGGGFWSSPPGPRAWGAEIGKAKEVHPRPSFCHLSMRPFIIEKPANGDAVFECRAWGMLMHYARQSGALCRHFGAVCSRQGQEKMRPRPKGSATLLEGLGGRPMRHNASCQGRDMQHNA